MYLLMIRLSHLDTGDPVVCIGKRTIASLLGKGTRASGGNFQHITERLQKLVKAGYVEIGETDRNGTQYTVFLPTEITEVRARIDAHTISANKLLDYYNDPVLRKSLFERDDWRCKYCGDVVTTETVTLDNIIPMSRGGTNVEENLATCYMMCNSIKSGRTFEEAAPQILARLRAQKVQVST
ncbi:MAG: HNH endonuclease [Thaumarchaeota archaeon]|nr:HNH endonuclease [Nitrososphaerota archaeon]